MELSFDCNICPSPLTDHCAITLYLCNRIRSLISEITVQDDLSPMHKWEWLKYNVRKIGIQEGKLANLKRKQQLVIISKINYLCSKTGSNDDNNIELHQLQSKLDDLYTEKTKGAFICSRARWIEDAEKNSSYFFNLEKHNLKRQ